MFERHDSTQDLLTSTHRNFQHTQQYIVIERYIHKITRTSFSINANANETIEIEHYYAQYWYHRPMIDTWYGTVASFWSSITSTREAWHFYSGIHVNAIQPHSRSWLQKTYIHRTYLVLALEKLRRRQGNITADTNHHKTFKAIRFDEPHTLQVYSVHFPVSHFLPRFDTSVGISASFHFLTPSKSTHHNSSSIPSISYPYP